MQRNSGEMHLHNSKISIHMKQLSFFAFIASTILACSCTKTADYYIFPIGERFSVSVSPEGGEGSIGIYSAVRKHQFMEIPVTKYDDRSTPVAYAQALIVFNDGVELCSRDFTYDRELDMLVADYADIHIESTTSTYKKEEFNPKGFIRYSFGKCPENLNNRSVKIVLSTNPQGSYTDNTGYGWLIGDDGIITLNQ